jgi:hypothetical protein
MLLEVHNIENLSYENIYTQTEIRNQETELLVSGR